MAGLYDYAERAVCPECNTDNRTVGGDCYKCNNCGHKYCVVPETV